MTIKRQETYGKKTRRIRNTQGKKKDRAKLIRKVRNPRMRKRNIIYASLRQLGFYRIRIMKR